MTEDVAEIRLFGGVGAEQGCGKWLAEVLTGEVFFLFFSSCDALFTLPAGGGRHGCLTAWIERLRTLTRRWIDKQRPRNSFAQSQPKKKKQEKTLLIGILFLCLETQASVRPLSAEDCCFDACTVEYCSGRTRRGNDRLFKAWIWQASMGGTNALLKQKAAEKNISLWLASPSLQCLYFKGHCLWELFRCYYPPRPTRVFLQRWRSSIRALSLIICILGSFFSFHKGSYIFDSEATRRWRCGRCLSVYQSLSFCSQEDPDTLLTNIQKHCCKTENPSSGVVTLFRR